MSGFFTAKLFCVPSLHTVLRRKSRCTAHTSLRSEHLYKLFGILLHGRFISSHPFIYFPNHFFILLCTHGYLFCTSGYTVILSHSLISFVAQIVPALAVGRSFGSLLCRRTAPLPCPNPIIWVRWFFCSVLGASLLSGTKRCSRLIMYISCSWDQHVSQGPWFLLLENSSRNQELELSVLR